MVPVSRFLDSTPNSSLITHHASLRFGFALDAVDPETGARAGRFATPHGVVQTPTFFPVGTQATVKTLDAGDLLRLGAELILANTYHLYLRPGPQIIAEFGGLHGFMAWPRPILTDSGGFQVFSLRQNGLGASACRSSSQQLVRIDDDGVTFRSYIDGSSHRFTPEHAVDVQAKLGADVIMAFDECSPNDADRDYAVAALERTHAWALRCRDHWLRLEARKLDVHPQALFAIVQGGNFRDLRERSAEFVASLDLPGVAIGGESVGYSKERTKRILEWVRPILPVDRPRYAMGVGDPVDFFAVVERGVDFFDSVLPTRLARNGTIFTRGGRLRILNAPFARDEQPLEPGCICEVCQRFSRAYVRHLFKAGELLAYRLTTIHNVHFCLDLMRQIRRAIVEGRFTEFRDHFLAEYGVVSNADKLERGGA